MKKAWYAIIRFAVHAATVLRIYPLKSFLYRAFFERQFQDVPLYIWHDFKNMAEFIRPQMWKADGWETMFDAISYPGKAQLVFEGKLEPKKNFDCDDFAIWIAASLEKSRAAGAMQDIQGVGMMSCVWAEGYKVTGHNVCLFARANGFFVMDYATPVGPFPSPKQAAADVARRYSKANCGTPLVMCVHDYKLRPLKSETL